jgi:hypothetical protein
LKRAERERQGMEVISTCIYNRALGFWGGTSGALKGTREKLGEQVSHLSSIPPDSEKLYFTIYYVRDLYRTSLILQYDPHLYPHYSGEIMNQSLSLSLSLSLFLSPSSLYSSLPPSFPFSLWIFSLRSQLSDFPKKLIVGAL